MFLRNIVFCSTVLFSVFLINLELRGGIEESSVYLLSSPRSANTWTRYCIENLVGRRTKEIDPRKAMNEPLAYLLNYEVDETLPFVYKLHRPPVGENENYLIVLVRDYMELFESAEMHTNVWPLIFSIKNYMDILKTYDEWSKHKRLLIYYEDLVLKPRTELKRLCNFFSCSDEKVSPFLRNIKEHKKKLIKIYEEYERPIKTNHDTKYYKKKMKKRRLLRLKKKVRAINPTVYKKYLSRY